MKLVNNEKKYWEFIRESRNTNNGFVTEVNLSKEEQEIYMSVHNNDYYICLLKNKPIGFIGVVNNDLRLFVKKEHRRKGVATFMIDEMPGVLNNIKIRVLYDNIPSRRLFKKLYGQPKFVLYEF